MDDISDIASSKTLNSLKTVSSLNQYSSYKYSYLDNLILNDKYGSLSTFRNNLDMIDCTAKIAPDDTHKSIKNKIETANSSLDELISSVQNSYNHMNAAASKWKIGSAIVGAIGVGGAVWGYFHKSGPVFGASIAVLIASGTFALMIYESQKSIEMNYSGIIDECKDLRKIIKDKASMYVKK